MTHKYVYFFGANQTEGKAELRELLGGKGANLAEMANLGINVPPVSPSPLKPAPIIFKKNKSSRHRCGTKCWTT